MNYFGLFFTFMVPGIALGAMMVAAANQEKKLRRSHAAHRRAKVSTATAKAGATARVAPAGRTSVAAVIPQAPARKRALYIADGDAA